MKKAFLSTLFALSLCLCLLSTAALATGGAGTIADLSTLEQGLTVGSSSGGDELQLANDITANGTAISCTRDGITLDLNNHSLTGSSTLTVSGGSNLTIIGSGTVAWNITIESGGTLTVDSAVTLGNVSVNADGRVEVNADAKFSSLSITGGIAALNSGTFTTLSVGSGEQLKDRDFLGTGRAYCQTAESRWLTDADLNTHTLSDVSVKEIPLTMLNTLIDYSPAIPFFGDPITLRVTYTGTATGTISYKWYAVSGETATLIPNETGSTLTVTPDAGEHIYRCAVTLQGYTLDLDRSVYIHQKALDWDMIDAPLEVPFQPNFSTGEGIEQTLEVAVKHNGVTLVKDKDYTISGDLTGTDAGCYYYTVTGMGNYTGSVEHRVWQIMPAQINAYTIKVSDKVYDGTVAVTISEITATIGTGSDAKTLTLTEDLYTSALGFDNASVGENKEVLGYVKLKENPDGGCNYHVLSDPNSFYASKVALRASITKATVTPSDSGMLYVKNGLFQSYQYDLSTLLPSLPVECQYGGFSFSNPVYTPVSGKEAYYSSTDPVSVAGNQLSLYIQETASTDEGKIGTVQVTVSSSNYADFTVTVDVLATNKSPLREGPALSKTTLTYGETLSAITLSGAMYDASRIDPVRVEGSFRWADPTQKYDAGSHQAAWIFTPTDSEHYQETRGAATVTVLKAQPPAPEFDLITEDGKTLDDVSFHIAGLTASLTWEDDTNTSVRQGRSYRWTLTPTLESAKNYLVLTDSTILWPLPPAPSVPPSTGGSSSGSTSSSTTVTVPVTSESSSVSVKAEVTKTGTATVEISDKQIEEVAQHGSGTVTVDVSKLENVESVQVPAHVVETTNKAEGTGLTVALPAGSVTLDETALESVSSSADVTVAVQQVSATDLTETQQKAIGDTASIGLVVDVDLFVGAEKQSTFNGGTLTISVPYTPKSGEDTSKLTVWFIRDDGTIENKGGYYDAAKGCFVFETGHLSRYVLVYNDKALSFTDVASDAYYAAAVNWAVSQNITDGIGGGKFGPDLSCTRAQIVTFLYRCAMANGVDVTVGEDTNILSYTDALEIPEYAVSAFQWAVGAGIIQGVDGRLMPNDDCTRAQIVTMLYRYEVSVGNDVSVGEDTNILSYTDFASVPEYAVAPFQWACGANIIQGADGKLMPNDTCTRAQIVTMLYRLLGE